MSDHWRRQPRNREGEWSEMFGRAMTERHAFIVRTSKELAGSVMRNVLRDLGPVATESDVLTSLRPRARKAADDFLSETRVQEDIAGWDRTRLVNDVARDIEDRVRIAIQTYRVKRRESQK